MAVVLKGKEVADAMTARMRKDVAELKEKGCTPTLCILRVGERPMTWPMNAELSSGPGLSI